MLLMHLVVRTYQLAGAVSVAGCLPGGGSAAARVTFIPVGSLPGYTQSQAVAVSADGSVVAGTASTPSGNRRAVRWTARLGLSVLGFAATGTKSAAAGVSAEGTVILVNGDGWTLTRDNAIFDDGRTVVGDGESPDQQAQVWLLRWPNGTGRRPPRARRSQRRREHLLAATARLAQPVPWRR